MRVKVDQTREREEAVDHLMEQVGLSKAMATQELDRYMVRMPGQAGNSQKGCWHSSRR